METGKIHHIGVGLSGGVDSAAACLRLLENGHQITGFTMLLNDQSDGTAQKGAAVARLLGVPHVVIDLRQEFKRLILDPFTDSYARGLTPSPCVLCNAHFKFGALWDAVSSYGCDRLATGHYVRTALMPDGSLALLRGADRRKDQSYFLAQLTCEQLSRAIFPLADAEKSSLKDRIIAMGIVPKSETESQDLCFLPSGDFASVVAAQRPDLVKDGPVIDLAGKLLGHHRGAFQYTAGQRRGLGLGGGPWFVVRTDISSNTVVVAHAEDMGCSDLMLSGMNWLAGQPDGRPLETAVQVRYLMTPKPATLTPLPDGHASLHFHTPVMAAPPGQLAVAYDGDRVMASGWIMPPDTPMPRLLPVKEKRRGGHAK